MSPNILERIMETKRAEIARDRAAEPIEALRDRVAEMPRCRNFHSAMTARPARRANLIAEVKKASPSAGVIREDFDPVAIARIYEQAGAATLSVLTDRQYFKGSLDYLGQIKQHVALPLLRKDFILDPYQLYQSRAAGADAVLLIAACLAPGTLMDLVILATELSLTTLIEVHDADELMQVRSLVGFPQANYVLLGINNRDLKTFHTDLSTTLRLASFVEDTDVLVSESGIHTGADVERLAAAGVRNILVGESLMRADDIAGKVHELLGPENRQS
jgi:indole-3-glycerol phosphate synthase